MCNVLEEEYLNWEKREDNTDELPPPTGQELYNSLLKIWNDNDMKTFRDFLIYYNNLDTKPCVQAVVLLQDYYRNNKAIRDGRPRPPRHQGFIAISYGGSELRHRSILETITHRPKCQIQKL